MTTKIKPVEPPNEHALLELSPVCAKVVDRNLLLRYMSRSGVEALAIDDITEYYGKPYPLEFYPEGFRNKMIARLEHARETGQPDMMEGMILNLDGEEQWFQSSIVPVLDDHGEVDYFNVVSINTTARHQAEKALQDEQKKLRSLTEELILAEERERKRIGLHLHEDICQNLTYAKMMVHMAAESGDQKLASSHLEKSESVIQEVMKDIRSLSFDLSAPQLLAMGLENALECWLKERIELGCGISTTLRKETEPIPLREDIQYLLFRCARELLNNTVKHSQASRVDVNISNVENFASIQIQDNGIGFDPAQIDISAGQAGLGLFSIRERMAQINGRIDIDSSLEKGTTVTLTAPLESA